MKKLLAPLFLSVSLLQLVSTPVTAQNQEIILSADEWCPYNCAEEAKKQGFMIDIVRHILEPHGVKVKYKVLPWARAIESAQVGRVDGIIAPAIDEAPGLLYPKHPLGMNISTIFTTNDSKWTYSNIDSLKSISLGVINGYNYFPEIDSYIAKNEQNAELIQKSFGELALDKNIKKLEAGRIDAFIDNELVVINYFSKEGRELPFKTAHRFIDQSSPQESFLYVAISPKTPNAQEIVNYLDQGIVEMAKSGKLKKLTDKYSVPDFSEYVLGVK